jgi:tRNA pseudouridine38-40 synthase
MLIMVIRTNTPRSVIGNSFGFSKIDIPDTPAGFMILDQPHYNNYNADSEKSGKQPVHFGDVVGLREFREKIHEAVVAKEYDQLLFEQWLRQIDNYSFMYTHFLNERGLIQKPKNMPRVSDVAPATV